MRTGVLCKLSKTEVSNFGSTVVQEDIGNFQVPVDDIFFSQIEESLKDILDYGLRLELVKVALFAKAGLEVTFVAELSYDVAVSVAGEDLETFEHVRMVEFLQDVNLGKQKFLKLFAFE